MTENAEQALLFEWSSYKPELSLMYAIPNGGYRHIATAVMLRKTGTKSGVPDVFLPVAKGNYHGLFLELKRQKGGALSSNQKIWLNALEQQGYKCIVAKGFEQAKAAIEQYMAL